MPTAIWLRLFAPSASLATSSIRRFYTVERTHAIDVSRLFERSGELIGHRIPKVDGQVGLSALNKLVATQSVESIAVRSSAYQVHYQEACRYWAKSSTFAPRFVRNGEPVDQPHGRTISLMNARAAGFVNCLINSSLFYWYYSTLSDCEHINDSLLRSFPLPKNWDTINWSALSVSVDKALRKSATPKTINTKQGHVIEYDEICGKSARDAIFHADIALGQTFGFSQAELDYIVNYDIKYRMGQGADEDD